MDQLQIRKAYEKKRYLRDLAADEFVRRGIEIYRNFLTINKELKLSTIPQNDENFFYWFERLNHYVQETYLRFNTHYTSKIPEFPCKEAIVDPRDPYIRAAAQLINSINYKNGWLVRYGKQIHLKPALNNGEFRIAPASSYKDPSLNSAMADDELEIVIQVYEPSPDEMAELSSGRHRKIPEDAGSVLFSRHCQDFSVLCLSYDLSAKSFTDFKADACLIIKDPKAFRDRLMIPAMMQLGASGYSFELVEYIDPYQHRKRVTGLHKTKRDKYKYQKEIRAAWSYKDKYNRLIQPATIHIGSLQDIAELVCL